MPTTVCTVWGMKLHGRGNHSPALPYVESLSALQIMVLLRGIYHAKIPRQIKTRKPPVNDPQHMLIV
ncbi:uncharacterized protein LACBIDRAFT_297263 [Laccaria bicolor S238N-H82]|uniref:Predicted protein n=1 Tax=Laccaria bicolor (strain S238N-H82 / ATCC MYA-4686) TaxID=486041 RepID=B0DAE0_LACBS|nr:uncharacterized protein LACBIDRAFT_297263 [Laccaria bicolor S238N-H82]EDR08735.1 predicted protein [Laccaria bicolor S238N-H82]|eukprot:XP_001880960.1 predicted protein [Laccaria bicolor S238N-H82]